MKLLGAMLGSLSSGAVVGAAAIKSEILGLPLSEATLMHIEDELDKEVGKSGITRSPLFTDLSKMINDTMAPSILTAHSGAESQLDGFRTAFEVCTTPDVSTDSSETTSKAISDKLAEHRQCRQNEQTAKMGADECDKDLKQKTAVQQSGCNSVPGSDGTPPALDTNGHVGCKVTAGDYEGWLNSFSHQIESLKTQFDEAKGGCGNATKLVDDAKPKCVAANQSAATNKSACDGLQAQADQMGCSNDPTAAAACQTYHSCYDAAKKNYLDANESIAAAQLNRTVQWRVLKRIQCLLKEEAAEATHAGIDACREATIDTSHLDLVYPDVPSKVDCSVQAGGPRPCSSEWIDLYGVSNPPAAPAAACTPCVTPPPPPPPQPTSPIGSAKGKMFNDLDMDPKAVGDIEQLCFWHGEVADCKNCILAVQVKYRSFAGSFRHPPEDSGAVLNSMKKCLNLDDQEHITKIIVHTDATSSAHTDGKYIRGMDIARSTAPQASCENQDYSGSHTHGKGATCWGVGDTTFSPGSRTMLMPGKHVVSIFGWDQDPASGGVLTTFAAWFGA